MLKPLSDLREIWICPPTCDAVHGAFETARMFGLASYRLIELRKTGLHPYVGRYYDDYRYQCQDIQAFAYSCELPVGINYRPPCSSPHYERLTEPYREATYRPVRNYVPGYVYLFHWNSIYKIGMTVNDVDKRAQQIKSSFPGEIQVLHSIKSEHKARAESYLHKRFKQHRIDGTREWFNLPPEAVQWICALEDGEIDELSEVLRRY